MFYNIDGDKIIHLNISMFNPSANDQNKGES